MSHFHPSQHRAYATGSMFWCITKTTDKSKANLIQQVCEVSLPKVTVPVPGVATKQTKLAAAEMPQVHELTSMALVKKGTRLVALDNAVVSKAREAEKKEEAKRRLAEQKTMADKRALDAQARAAGLPPSQRQRTG